MTSADDLRLADYLGHILQAIERCLRYAADIDESAFLQDTKTQDAVIRTLEVMGEAANNIKKRYPEYARQHPKIPFGFAIGMRNLLAHGYFQVDLGIVWKTVHTDLPPLRQTIQDLIESLDQG